MSTFAFVASPLVGPPGWQWLAGALQRRGQVALVPDLAPSDAPTPQWRAHVERITQQLGGLDEVALVGHSAAGRLIPLVADRVANAACIFLDAQLPVDVLAPADDDWFLAHVRSLAVDGRLPPWSEWWGDDAWDALVPDPTRRAALARTLPLVTLESVQEVPPAPHTPMRPAYVRLSSVYDAEADVAEELGWLVTRLAGGHLHFAVDEDAVADVLITTASQLAD